MNDRLLATSALSDNGSTSTITTVPTSAVDHLGEADTVCWFLDEDTGLIYAVPDSEVTIR